MFAYNQYFSPGDVIVSEGEQGDRIFRVISGEILICRGKESGDMVALGKIGPGEIFGEMYLWDKEKKRFASAIATQETILEVIFDSELTPEVYSQICSDMIKKVKNTSVTYTQAVRKARINSPEGSQPGVVPNKRLMTSNSRAPRIPADVIVLNNSDY